MDVSEVIANKREYLVDWIGQELKAIPVTVFGKGKVVNITFQEMLIWPAGHSL